jgi:hypothetical protein
MLGRRKRGWSVSDIGNVARLVMSLVKRFGGGMEKCGPGGFCRLAKAVGERQILSVDAIARHRMFNDIKLLADDCPASVLHPPFGGLPATARG